MNWKMIVEFNNGQPASTMKLMVKMWKAAQTAWDETMVSNLLNYPLDPLGVAEQLDNAGVKVPDEVTKKFII